MKEDLTAVAVVIGVVVLLLIGFTVKRSRIGPGRSKKNEKGQSTTEYALLIAQTCLACWATILFTKGVMWVLFRLVDLEIRRWLSAPR